MTHPIQPTTAPPVIFVLRISRGSFETGFAATLEISQPGQVTPPQKYTLPACTHLLTDYKKWQATYTKLGQSTHTSLSQAPNPGQGPTPESPENICKKATLSFEDRCLEWFAQPTFEALRRSILAAAQLHQLQQVSISLEVSTHEPEQNDLLRKLPWHIWALFEEDLRRSELTLNAPVTPTSQPLTAPLKILAIFGDQSGETQTNAKALTLKNELAALQTHLETKGARMSVLNQPSARELQETLRKQPWDMLFFSGNNNSFPDTPGGVIHLKDNVVLTLRDLKASLNTAVENGLKLAIFNACDGLDLANYLSARKVPISIVMREPVPERVAHYFSKYFLEEFSQGQLTLAAAVRIARERLQWLESDGSQACPAATWLPIVAQHPKQRPLYWPALEEGRQGSLTVAPPVASPVASPVAPPALAGQSAPSTTLPTTLPTTPPTTLQSSHSAPASTAGQPVVGQPLSSQAIPGQPGGQSTVVAASQTTHQNTSLTPAASLSSAASSAPAHQPPNKAWRKWALGLLALLVVGGVTSKILNRNKYTLPPVNDTNQSTAAPPAVYKTLEDRFSVGDRAIITEEANYIACPENNKADFNTAKRSGTRAMRSQQYEAATQAFEEAWSLCPAPEVLIYRNNARIAAKSSHTLAVVVPINWPNPKNAIEMLRGAAQSQTLINKSGGINGVPIRLMVIDDGDKPEVAKNIAATLVDDYPNVLAVIGHWTSGVTTAAASVYDARRSLVFMTPVSTTRDLNGDTGWVFRSTINMRDAQKVLAEYAISTAGYQKVATFSLDSAKVGEARALYSEGLQDEFAQSFADVGGQVVNNFDLGSPDFQENMALTAKTMIRQAKRQGAEAVLLIPDNSLVPNAEALIQEADKQGLGLLGVTNLYREEVLKNNCPAIEGLTMTIAWTADGPANPDFVRASSSSEFWRGEVNFATAMTYNATQAIAAAMEKSPTRAGIYTTLNREGFEVTNTADAEPMRFQNGSRTATAELVTVVKQNNGLGGVAKCEFAPTP